PATTSTSGMTANTRRSRSNRLSSNSKMAGFVPAIFVRRRHRPSFLTIPRYSEEWLSMRSADFLGEFDEHGAVADLRAFRRDFGDRPVMRRGDRVLHLH